MIEISLSPCHKGRTLGAENPLKSITPNVTRRYNYGKEYSKRNNENK